MQYSILESSTVSERTYFSFWQSWVWYDILLASGQAREVFYFWNLGQNILLIEIRSLGLGQYWAFSLWVSGFQIDNMSEEFMSELLSLLKNKGCIFYQIEPLDELKFNLSGHHIKKKAYKNFLTPYTRLLDLSFSEGELLSQMHEKGRYNIRLAEKRWVNISKMPLDTKSLDIWMDLLHETTVRDDFSHNSRQYYEIFIRELEKTGRWELLFAFYEGHVIAASIVVYMPMRAIYYYWVSTSDKSLRKHMAPYLLQWHAICEAKKRHIPVYDFLWIADPNDPHDTLSGVSDFKEKFWWKIVELPEKIIIHLSWKTELFLFLRSILKR